MTRGSVKEYLEAVQGRYRKAARQEKGRILDEFVRVTGYHRPDYIGAAKGVPQRGHVLPTFPSMERES